MVQLVWWPLAAKTPPSTSGEDGASRDIGEHSCSM